MSEYQYYEFQAIDRPLDEADREALRALSSRAKITATGFANEYNFGDFRGDPAILMERWFDLHLYFAQWGSRRLMIRWPVRPIDRLRLADFIREVDAATLRQAGANLILDVSRDELESDEWEEDGTGVLAALAPLRADVLAGDLRLFYLLWLMAVEEDVFEADALEPMPGIGPLTASLQAFASFFDIDPDLVAAAAESSAGLAEISSDAALYTVAQMTDHEKNALLVRLFGGDPLVGAELRSKVRERQNAEVVATPARTVGELRARAEEIRIASERAEAEREAAEEKRKAEEAEKIRRARVDSISKRGASVWPEVEAVIELRNAKGYEKAVELLRDLRTLADDRGGMQDFQARLLAIRERHSTKRTFIERLTDL
jgi:hypothetical protein